MIAPSRRRDAANPVPAIRSASAVDLWQEAVKIRIEWLGHGLSTRPADRPTTERNLTAIYARVSRPRPRFVWVDSPAQALPLVTGLPSLEQLYEWTRNPHRFGPPPLASDVATAVSRLRGALSAGVSHPDPELSPVRRAKSKDPWPELAPLNALASGVPLAVVLHQGVRTALHRSLVHGFCLPVRAALAGHAEGAAPVCWYGQQDTSWIAYYDILDRLGLARYGPDETEHLAQWAALGRSCGWWWPGERVCVVVERPALIRTEPVAGSLHDEVRLDQRGTSYRDGWRPQVT